MMNRDFSMLPVHGYGHRDSAVHGSYHLVVGGFEQADVVSAIIIATKKKRRSILGSDSLMPSSCSKTALRPLQDRSKTALRPL